MRTSTYLYTGVFVADIMRFAKPVGRVEGLLFRVQEPGCRFDHRGLGFRV